MLQLSVPDEPPITLQSGGIAVSTSVGRLTAASQYFSESGDFHAVYPAGSLACTGNSDDILQMSAVSYRTSIGDEPSAPASLLRVGSHAHISLYFRLPRLVAFDASIHLYEVDNPSEIEK